MCVYFEEKRERGKDESVGIVGSIGGQFRRSGVDRYVDQTYDQESNGTGTSFVEMKREMLYRL